MIDKHSIFCYYKSQVGEIMVCRVIEGKENSIKNYGNIIEIIIDDFSYLEKPSRLFEKVILNYLD